MHLSRKVVVAIEMEILNNNNEYEHVPSAVCSAPGESGRVNMMEVLLFLFRPLSVPRISPLLMEWPGGEPSSCLCALVDMLLLIFMPT